MSRSGALYRKRNCVGVILLKILGKMLAVGFASHRRIWGIGCRLEHLMRHCELRSVRNSYGTCEKTLSRVETKEHVEFIFQISKPTFLLE